MNLETRHYSDVQLRNVDEKKRRITVVISTYDIDSHGTRIDQEGWDFSVFRKNPVVPLAHDDRGYTGSNGLPVAKGIPDSIRVENQRTMMDIEFPPTGVFPLADTVFELVRNGFINAVSVGFEPLDWTDEDEEDRTVRIFRKQRLLEVSIVTIPSNSNALVQRARKLNREAEVEAFRELSRKAEQLSKGEEPTEVRSEEENAKLVTMTSSTTLDSTDPEYVAKCIAYFEKKQPANRESTKVLEKFFKKLLQEDAPADEVKAWQKMAAFVESLESRQDEEEEEEDKKKKSQDEEEEDEKKNKQEDDEEEPKKKKKKAQEDDEEEKADDEEEEKSTDEEDADKKKKKKKKKAESEEEDDKEEKSSDEEEEEEEKKGKKKKAEDEEEVEEEKKMADDEAEDGKEEKSIKQPIAVEAPRLEPKASVQMSLAQFVMLPRVIAETVARSAVEALQRGTPVKDVGEPVEAALKALKAALVHP